MIAVATDVSGRSLDTFFQKMAVPRGSAGPALTRAMSPAFETLVGCGGRRHAPFDGVTRG
jgi:hypothetical protein